jgi:D-tyrosyl-tRNA(Tyr) deacylase
MLVSQFTLFGEPVKGKGNRLDFHRAMAGPEAKVLFDEFVRRVENRCLLLARRAQVRCGEFGAPMRVALENDGPCTIIIEKRTKEAEEKDINKQPAATTDE